MRVAGVDIGLGRNEGFRLSDWRNLPRQGGPGRPPARFEFPSMLCSFPRDTVEALLNSGLVEETECACNACLLGSTTEECLKRAAEHNLAMLKAQQLQLAGLSIRDRMAALRDGILRARAIRRRLHTFVPTFNDRMDHLAVLERCLDEVERTGLLEPGQAARRAGQ